MPLGVLERFFRPLRRPRSTSRYPDGPTTIAPATRGLPELDASRCDASATCVDVCPTGAISLTPGAWTVDAGRCVFCAACAIACPRDAIRLGQRVELAAGTRDALHITTAIGERP